MGEGIKLGGGNGRIVNGKLVKFMAATNDIKANTFVKVVKGVSGKFTTPVTNTNSITKYSDASSCKLIKLSTTKALILWANPDADYYTCYCAVVNINGENITFGTTVEIGYVFASVNGIGLNESRVLIYSGPTAARGYFWVLTIDGDTVTVGARNELNITNNYVYYMEKISESKVMIGHTDYVSYVHKGFSMSYLNIAGDVVTVDKTINILDAEQIGVSVPERKVSVCKVDDTRYLMTWCLETSTTNYRNYSTRAMCFSIVDGTVAKGEIVDVVYTYRSKDSTYDTDSHANSLFVIDESTAIMSILLQSGYDYLGYYYAIKISDLTVTVGVQVSMSSSELSMDAKPMIFTKLPAEKGCIGMYHVDTDDNRCLTRICRIFVNDLVITIDSDFLVRNNGSTDHYYACGSTIIELEPGKCLALYACPYEFYTLYMHAYILYPPKFCDHIERCSSGEAIAGLTATKATPTSAGKVWVLA